jgi:electron transfer flavoprotein alpha subunit
MAKDTGVWVFAEQRDGKLLDISLEMLGGGRELANKTGQELSAVLLGDKVAPLAKELAAYGADKVYVADSPLLKYYCADAYALVIEDMINQHNPSIFLVGGTNIGMDLAPTVAAKVNTGVSAHSVGIDVDKDGCLMAKVPAFGGSVLATILCMKSRPQMATVKAGFLKPMAKDTKRKAAVENVPVKITEKDMRTKVLKVFTEEEESQPLESADTVIAGGYGIGKKENWAKLEELASVLGGSVGATRPACDEGWAVQEKQMIGQSGKTVRPKLYIGVGVAGIIHHLIGIQNSKVIVAINKDPDAPIMKAADYAIPADFNQILPVLIDELKKAKK